MATETVERKEEFSGEMTYHDALAELESKVSERHDIDRVEYIGASWNREGNWRVSMEVLLNTTNE